MRERRRAALALVSATALGACNTIAGLDNLSFTGEAAGGAPSSSSSTEAGPGGAGGAPSGSVGSMPTSSDGTTSSTGGHGGAGGGAPACAGVAWLKNFRSPDEQVVKKDQAVHAVAPVYDDRKVGSVRFGGWFDGSMATDGLPTIAGEARDGFVAAQAFETGAFEKFERLGGAALQEATGLAVQGSTLWAAGSFDKAFAFDKNSFDPNVAPDVGSAAFALDVTAPSSPRFAWVDASGQLVEKARVAAPSGAIGLAATFKSASGTSLRTGVGSEVVGAGSVSCTSACSTDAFVARFPTAPSFSSAGAPLLFEGLGAQEMTALAASGADLIVGVKSEGALLIGGKAVSVSPGATGSDAYLFRVDPEEMPSGPLPVQSDGPDAILDVAASATKVAVVGYVSGALEGGALPSPPPASSYLFLALADSGLTKYATTALLALVETDLLDGVSAAVAIDEGGNVVVAGVVPRSGEGAVVADGPASFVVRLDGSGTSKLLSVCEHAGLARVEDLALVEQDGASHALVAGSFKGEAPFGAKTASEQGDTLDGFAAKVLLK